MPSLFFLTSEFKQIWMGNVVKLEEKTQYNMDEEGSEIKKNLYSVTLSPFNPQGTSFLFNLLSAIAVVCAVFLLIFVLIFSGFWRNLFLMFFLFCTVNVPLLQKMKYNRLGLKYHVINPQPFSLLTGKIQMKYMEFNGKELEEYISEDIYVLADIVRIVPEGFTNIEGLEPRLTIVSKLWATEDDVKKLEEEIKKTGTVDMSDYEGILVPEDYYKNGIPAEHISFMLEKMKSLDEVKKFFKGLETEKKNIIDMNKLKLAFGIFAIKFDEKAILQSENARLQTRLAKEVETKKRSVEMIEFYRNLVSTLPGIGNRIEKILAKYSLELPPEKFERFMHIAFGSSKAETMLASAKSEGIASELAAAKELWPHLKELRGMTAELAEVVWLDPEKITELNISLEHKLSSGDQETQQRAKEIIETDIQQKRDMLKKYGAE